MVIVSCNYFFSKMRRSQNLNPKAGTKPFDVILFVPNLIGYTRILLSTFALLFMSVSPSLWVLATGLYLISVRKKRHVIIMPSYDNQVLGKNFAYLRLYFLFLSSGVFFINARL